MPGNKHRTRRRRRRKPPVRSPRQQESFAPRPSSSTATATTRTPAASEKKLCKSPHAQACCLLDDLGPTQSSYENYDGQGARILEVGGLKAVLDKSVCCRKCGTGSVMFKDNFSRQQGTNNASFFECNTCSAVTPVPFSTVGSSKVFSLNQKMALASKMAGGNLSTLKTLMVHHRFGESQNALI